MKNFADKELFGEVEGFLKSNFYSEWRITQDNSYW